MWHSSGTLGDTIFFVVQDTHANSVHIANIMHHIMLERSLQNFFGWCMYILSLVHCTITIIAMHACTIFRSHTSERTLD